MRGRVMLDLRIIGAGAHILLRRAGRLVRQLSLLSTSLIGIGIVYPTDNTALGDEPGRDERVVFRHFV